MKERLEQICGCQVSRETFEKITDYAARLVEENARQNLIGRSTIEDLWERHLLDAAQLVRFAKGDERSWIDIGSGAGLPGVVIALLVPGEVTLVEPRRLRAEFLESVIAGLELRSTVIGGKAERVTGKFDVITARAVATLPRLLDLSAHLSTRKTLWLLPKGRGAHSELAQAKRAWQGRFHVEQSATDSDSYIVVGTEVEARKP